MRILLGLHIWSKSLLVFALAAFFEIAGCFSFWAWLRLGKTPAYLIPGVLSLLVFAVLLTRTEPAFAGRAYAAYGGIYIATSLLWLMLVERVRPDRWDYIGSVLSIVGALVILSGRR